MCLAGGVVAVEDIHVHSKLAIYLLPYHHVSGGGGGNNLKLASSGIHGHSPPSIIVDQTLRHAVQWTIGYLALDYLAWEIITSSVCAN